MRARQLLEQLLHEGQVDFMSTVDTADGETPVHVWATYSYNQGVRGAAGDEPGWYVDLDRVETPDGRDLANSLDEPARSRLESETLDHFEH